ncbi:Na+/H+ antiporter [Nocardia sp. CDC159]|uniref:Na+/H+ antiporter n=1 Tax=Nocardia pulmonis TaxID=2951408 RepID=A0A9X2E640_9NOCA|nr:MULTISPECIES: Na+/H+ antiporter [Nocardia]MCM6774351.1 Na+/H+ antiporter [Nocardia pulmonis]MCM6787583.1 Na+/H+ antiporter [Nocardia sp. CDC159]
MDQLVLIFLLAFASILAQPLGRRVGLAPAVLMTVFGLVLAVIPAVPSIAVEPELILPLVLPPLLYASARRTSWQQFAANAGPILLRAVGLVIATAAAVAAVFHAWYPGLPLAAAFALGAVVAPPDPVAVSAMATRLGLPRRLVAMLEGEGLFNDVTAVVLYNVAVQAVVTGHFSAWRTVGEFILSAVVAIVVGVVLGWAGSRLMRRLGQATWQVALGLLLPFAAYGLAEFWHGSAVLAVLICALYLVDAATDFSDSSYRLVGDSVWEVIDLLVTGVAFGLIGLELTTVLSAAGPGWPQLLGGTAAVIAVVVLLRLVWLLVTTAAAGRWWRRRDTEEPHTWRESVVTWWAGMRGVVTVALALAVPLTTDAGAAFPGRDHVLFIAFAVVLFTLLLQGPTLSLVVRATHVQADTEAERVLERRLWTRILRAELDELDRIAAREQMPEETYQRLRDNFERRLARADPEAAQQMDAEDAKAFERWMHVGEKIRSISDEVVEAGRAEAQAARREPGMPPDLVDRVMRRLDLRPTTLL